MPNPTHTPLPATPRPPSHTSVTPRPKKLGLALGSGAARGWVHVGVLKALGELDVQPDVVAGCSAGALVGGAWLLGFLDEFEEFARTLSPLSALNIFSFQVSRGGLIRPDKAFESFKPQDKNIEDLPIPFGAVATDLGTGEEVWITKGSVLDAARASSAIPMIIQAAPWSGDDGAHWLVDGAITNPVPVSLCRDLGATHVIAIDVNPVTRTIERFKPSVSKAVAVIEKPEQQDAIENLPEPVAKLVNDTKRFFDMQMAQAKRKSMAQPHLFETAIAVLDIVQAQLSESRAKFEKPDLRLLPEIKGFTPLSFEKHEEMQRLGYDMVMNKQDEILKLAQH